MNERELFKETFSQLHASEDTLSEVMKMAKHENITYMNKAKRRHPARKLIAIAAVAVLLVTGAFAAGTAIYKMWNEPIGEYGLSIMVDFEGSEAVDTVHRVSVSPGWVPDGMTTTDGFKYYNETTPHQGGFSIAAHILNTGKETFRETIEDMESREELTIDGHEAVYVTLLNEVEQAGVRFNQRLYIVYPEYNQVICLYIGEDIDRDTAIRFAENLTVTQLEETVDAEQLRYINQRYREEEKLAKNATGGDPDVSVDSEPDDDPVTAITADEMEKVYQIGETFEAIYGGRSGPVELTTKVLEVAVSDDTSILRDTSYLSDYIAGTLDENGKLPTNTIQYIVGGDGVSNPEQTVVASEEKAQKLVAVTMEITNSTEEALEDISYDPNLTALVETTEGYAIFERQPESGVEYDYIVNSYYTGLGEMRYYDLFDTDSNGGNHIRDFAPGETVTLQVAYVVNADEVDMLYFTVDGEESSFEEDATYVDIRQ